MIFYMIIKNRTCVQFKGIVFQKKKFVNLFLFCKVGYVDIYNFKKIIG